jgi:ABC-2 type transport system ATP-binding protein
MNVAVSLIAIEGLTKRYGEFLAVDTLTLGVSRGEVFGFLGPNGAGKTTTIRMLMGILVPTSGSAHIDGQSCQSERVEVARRVGYLPDNPVFYDYLRGREILEFVGRMRGLPALAAEADAARLLSELELASAAEEFTVNYSTGMKKKLALACALIHDPAVLILDEPTNGLDPRASRQVQDRIRAAAAAAPPPC